MRKQVKQREDSVMSFEQGGRPELAEKEKTEIAILRGYLPQGLSEVELQAIVKDAAIQAARFEREISVEDVGPTSSRARKEGYKIVDLSNNERDEFVKTTAVVYDQFADYFSPGLIDSIKKL